MKFKIFGCEIELSLLFSSLICVLLLADKTGLMLLSLSAAAIHEIGHLIAMLIFKIKPEKMKFCAYGIIISKKWIYINPFPLKHPHVFGISTETVY